MNYDFSQARCNINLHVTYTGEQDDFTFLPPLFARQRVTLDSYTLVGIAGSWRLDRNLALFARAENVFDDDYQDVFGFETPGAAAYFGIRYTTSR